MHYPSLGLLVLLASCASAPPSPITRVERRDTIMLLGRSLGAGELTPEQLRALAPRIRAVQLEQGATTIAPGDTFSIERFAIRLLDSSGVTLGRTRLYDFGLKEGAAAMKPPPIVRGMRPGESQVHISFPRSLWTGRADPPAETFLRVVVRPRPPRRMGASGSHVLTERVRANYSSETTVPDSGPRQTRLQYILLWRAQPEWCGRPCSGADDPVSDSIRTLQREVAERGNVFVGSTGALIYGAEVDVRRRLLNVLGLTVPFGIPDSATVVLVDQVDGVGGPPTVVRFFRIPSLIATDSTTAPGNTDLSRMTMPMPLLLDALRRAPVAREFIDHPPPRIPPAPVPARKAD